MSRVAESRIQVSGSRDGRSNLTARRNPNPLVDNNQRLDLDLRDIVHHLAFDAADTGHRAF